MNNKAKLFFKTFIICAMCCAIFVGAGYLYLSRSISDADGTAENVPYTQQPPENCGILVNFGGEIAFFYVDFLQNTLTVSLTPEPASGGKIYGYTHDCTVDANADFVTVLFDELGGAQLNLEGEKLRYTGLQISEILKRSHSKELRRDLISAACENIAENGISSAFFSKLIKNSETDLTLTDCYFWHEYLPSVCENLHFID